LSTPDLTTTEEFDVLLKRAVEFHGHLGPFLVLGLRMGLAGLRELKVRRGERKLHVMAKLLYTIPFSCTVDGLQMSTKCTVGNKRLKIMNYSGIKAKFKLKKGEEVTVAVNSAFLDMLKTRLPSESCPSEEIRELAQFVAYLPEEELFSVSRG
jgi:formylmethanofuran dehydrogenase subunit E